MTVSARLRVEPLDARVTPAVLSDNLSATSAGVESATGNTFIASSFLSPTAGTLTSVTLKLANPLPGSSTLRLFTDANNQPGTALSTLTSPSEFSTAAANTTFTTAGVPLTANTTYWVVLSAPSGQFDWSFTNSRTGTGAGFVGSVAESANAGGSWSVFNVAPVQMRVETADVESSAPPAFAAGDGGSGTIRVYAADGSFVRSIVAFTGTLTGGVRTAVADVTGDGVADVIAGTGPGRATRVIVFDGTTGLSLGGFDPFEASFTGGVYVAAGDIDADGRADVVVTPDEGGGPRVDVYTGNGLARIASFFGIDDPNFRGGARAAVGDLNGDGNGDLVVSAGFGGGPRIAAFDGAAVRLNGGVPPKLFGDFFAFEDTLRNGVFIAVGDLNGENRADLIFGGGPGGGPRVLAFSGADLLSNRQTTLANFFGGDAASRGGIRVAAKSLDGDARADIVVGSGSGAGSWVTTYPGSGIAPTGTPTPTLDFEAFAGSTAGVYVG